MSTFQGLFAEIPGIAADRFDSECLRSKYLFLSHCHSDHMVGLQAADELPAPLFATEISAVFLQKQFPNISSAVEIIDINTPVELTYTFDGNHVNLVVNALPAKHCPGSVMFLFETQSRTVLYTGDFRIQRSHFHEYELLKDKVINTIYLDSTFLSNKFYEFPTRIESTREICSLISEWLSLNPVNKILIEMPAQYGIEFIFIVIQRKLNEKIHIQESQWEKYVYLPAMDDCISPDASKCRIFTKFKQNCRTPTKINSNYRVIKPTAMFWSNWRRGARFVMKMDNANEFRIAYSNHCSYSELKDFLEFTKPQRVSLNVVPERGARDMMECLETIYSCKPPSEPVVENKKPTIPCFHNIFLGSNQRKRSTYRVDIKFPPKRLKFDF